LTQTFFAYLLEKESLKKVDRTKGKFRTFLLTSLTNFLANEWDKRQTLKRGGGRQFLSLDEPTRRKTAERRHFTKFSKADTRESALRRLTCCDP
jgi:RNA polymerase sigma-70 factor (ECF subfamily)